MSTDAHIPSILTSEREEELRGLWQRLEERLLSPEEAARTPQFQRIAAQFVCAFWHKNQALVRGKSRNLDREDLLGPAMVALSEALRDYSPAISRRSKLKASVVAYCTWKMREACTREVRDNYKRANGRVSRPHETQVVSEHDVVVQSAAEEPGYEAVETAMQAQVILAAVARLPQANRWQDVVRMRLVEGLGFQEIAEALGENRGTVYREYQRALFWLRKDLQNEELATV